MLVMAKNDFMRKRKDAHPAEGVGDRIPESSPAPPCTTLRPRRQTFSYC